MPADEQKEIMNSINDPHTQKMKSFASRQLRVLQNITKAYGVVWGNCANALKTEVQSDSEYLEKVQAPIAFGYQTN